MAGSRPALLAGARAVIVWGAAVARCRAGICRLLCGAPILLVALSPCRGEDLALLSVGAMRPVLLELAPSFERASGHKLALHFATAAGTEQRIEAGESFDLALMGRPRMERLAERGKIVAGSIALVGRSPVGLAVKKGAPRPDIGTVDAFKKALLAARSIAYVDPASGGITGILLAGVLQELGIAAEVKAKTRLIPSHPGQPSLVAEAVANGEAEIGMQSLSELAVAAGIDVVGPIPAELQSPDLVYAVGVVAGSKRQPTATAFIAYLAGATAIVGNAKGLQSP